MDKSEIVGTIKLFAGNFCPSGYLYCDRQIISITLNLVLYNIIGNNYGGDGKNNFCTTKVKHRY